MAPTAALLPASHVKATSVQAAPSTPVMHATGFADWLRPESSQYKGLLLARQPSWRDCQDMVDRGANKQFGINKLSVWCRILWCCEW